VGRWLDLFLMILPSQPHAAAGFGVIETGLILGAAGVFLWAVALALGKNDLFVRSQVHEMP